MVTTLPETINVLLVAEPDSARRSRVQAVAASRLKVTEIAPADFASDSGALWPPARNPGREPASSREERDAVLRDAHVILLGLPYPTTLYSRTAALVWAHHPAAGASNLHRSDFWGAPVLVTTSRGVNSALPIAESVIAGALMFARGLHLAAKGSFARGDYAANVSFTGKTIGIVGLGGIGSHVARLARGLGMRVIATRRSATMQQSDVDGVHELFPAPDLHLMLAQSDYVAICAMLTAETENLIDAYAFAAMKPGAVLINIARGEIVDEPAMVAALESGKLRGAYLDVYAGELSGGGPPAALRNRTNVVITPHISGVSDNPGPRGFDLFLENLERLISGEPLKNVIDWERGY
jgi:phosphoglycerate dehydrogenase-like enzyme